MPGSAAVASVSQDCGPAEPLGVDSGRRRSTRPYPPYVPVYGPLALTAEKTAFAVLGEVASLITKGTEAQKQSFKDAGLDAQVIAGVEAILEKNPNVTALAAAAKSS